MWLTHVVLCYTAIFITVFVGRQMSDSSENLNMKIELFSKRKKNERKVRN